MTSVGGTAQGPNPARGGRAPKTQVGSASDLGPALGRVRLLLTLLPDGSDLLQLDDEQRSVVEQPWTIESYRDPVTHRCTHTLINHAGARMAADVFWADTGAAY